MRELLLSNTARVNDMKSLHRVYIVLLTFGFMLMYSTNVFGQCEPKEAQKLLASDGAADDHFGRAVSIWEDTAIMGVSLDNDNGAYAGSAYIYEKIDGEWVETAKLLPTEVDELDRFGFSVSIYESTLVIGAFGGDSDNAQYAGAAYIFMKVGGVWTKIEKIFASDGESNDQFGKSVSIFGDTILVGSLSDDNGISAGAVYVFEKIEDAWIQTDKLLASDGEQFDLFGRPISVWGNTTVIGASNDDDVDLGAGAAYIFEKKGGVWQEIAKLTANDGDYEFHFGSVVSLYDDTALIGTPKDGEIATWAGAAYIFEKINGIWTQTTKLTASDADLDDFFGISLNIVGDTAIVGAYREGENEKCCWPATGAAYVYQKIGGVWTETEKLTASDADDGDNFGISISIVGDSVLVGAYKDDDNGLDSGAIYVIDLNCEPICPWDLDKSGSVDTSDLLELFAQWGTAGPADFDESGIVNTNDLLILFANWGPCE